MHISLHLLLAREEGQSGVSEGDEFLLRVLWVTDEDGQAWVFKQLPALGAASRWLGGGGGGGGGG